MADTPESRLEKNALWRREEQLRRWIQSETNKESSVPREKIKVAVNFQDGCVFLAACSCKDHEEVENLLAQGADINTFNIDGLTALHQACIDDNLDMVKFLVEKDADINACDNEGWTPLHVTASCAFLDIARYLIDNGADVSAVNNDGELPYDISDGGEMRHLLDTEMLSQGIDAEAARIEEQEMMLRDANNWLANGYSEVSHAKTGATALHVAAAKGYMKVMNLLVKVGIDVDIKDYDGWSPLHAAAHWQQEEACELLAENFCNMEMKNLAGQTPLDVCDPDMIKYLKDLMEKQATMKKKRETDEQTAKLIRRDGVPPLKRSSVKNRTSVTRMSIDQKQSVMKNNVEEERAHMEAFSTGVLQEKEEDRKSESSSLDEASSDSDTVKSDDIVWVKVINRPQASPTMACLINSIYGTPSGFYKNRTGDASNNVETS